MLDRPGTETLTRAQSLPDYVPIAREAVTTERRHLAAADVSLHQASVLSPRIQLLVESILDLIIDKGFHETSVREIAAAVGWNMATLYHYVADKRDLLLYIEQWTHDQIDQFMATCQPSGQDAASRLEGLIDCYYRMLQKFPRHLRFLLSETKNFKPEHRRQTHADTLGRVAAFRELIDLGIRTGEFRPLDAEMAARDIYFLAWSWAISSSLIEDVGDFEQFLAFTKSFIIAGLRPRTAAPHG
jgi:AcrR family transcriptional regulator